MGDASLLFVVLISPNHAHRLREASVLLSSTHWSKTVRNWRRHGPSAHQFV